MVVVDAHRLVATSLATALRHVGFRKVVTVDPDEVHLNGHEDSIGVSAGDIALVGLLYGDGRTTLPLIRP